MRPVIRFSIVKHIDYEEKQSGSKKYYHSNVQVNYLFLPFVEKECFAMNFLRASLLRFVFYSF